MRFEQDKAEVVEIWETDLQKWAGEPEHKPDDMGRIMRVWNDRRNLAAEVLRLRVHDKIAADAGLVRLKGWMKTDCTSTVPNGYNFVVVPKEEVLSEIQKLLGGSDGQ